MLKVYQRFFPEVDSYKGSWLGFLNFRFKLYLAIAIFIAGVLCLGSMSIAHFNRQKHEFNSNRMKLINQQVDAISSIKYQSTALFNRCIAAVRYERTIDMGDSLNNLQKAMDRLKKLKGTPGGDVTFAAYKEFSDIYTNYSIFSINRSNYPEFKKVYRKFYGLLLELEEELLQEQTGLLRTRILSSLIFTGIMFLILIITVGAGGWVIITAVKTMVTPVGLIAKQLQKDETDTTSYLTGISTEGMGAVAFHLKEAEQIWIQIQSNFKDIARKLDEQCVDLVAGIKVQEISEVQINEAYKAIDRYISEQMNMTAQANEQVVFLVTNLSSLQRVPFQLKTFVEQIQNLLNTMETKLIAALNTPFLFKDCALEINSLFEDLGFTSMKILEVVNILTEVAGQAELLAFNTAIEAARAGIKGLGFGVVSKEIAKLVDRSQRAAVDLNSAVNQLESGMNAINQLVPQAAINNEKAAYFQQLATEICNNTFNTIRASIDDLLRLNQVFEEIIMKSGEITREANQISNLEFKEKNELRKMELEVIDYQLNVKESVRIAGKIEESIGDLKTLVAGLRKEKPTKPDLTGEAS
jgi:methyl-accepting chemotaxis protein